MDGTVTYRRAKNHSRHTPKNGLLILQPVIESISDTVLAKPTFKFLNLLFPMDLQYEVGDYSATFRTESVADIRRYSHQIKSEYNTFTRFISDISSEDTLWDIGANLGVYSCFAANLGCDVVAIEPNPDARSILKSNIRLNTPEYKILGLALGSEQGKSDLRTEPISAKSHLGGESANTTDTTTVKVLPGDDVATNLQKKPSIMKIDVEGFELEVLKGMDETLTESPPKSIFIEVHPQSLIDWGLTAKEQRELYRLLEDAGYSISEIQSEPSGAIHLLAEHEPGGN